MKTEQELKIRSALLDVEQHQLRARYYAKRIETGVWRNRVGHVFPGGLPEH